MYLVKTSGKKKRDQMSVLEGAIYLRGGGGGGTGAHHLGYWGDFFRVSDGDQWIENDRKKDYKFNS